MKVADLREIIVLAGLIWTVSILNLVLGQPLNGLAILPRSVSGLAGIPLAPLVHGSLGHLTCNTVPLLILGGMVSLRGAARFWTCTLLIVGLGGLAVWAFGRSAYHIGASGLVFGYFGYLVALGMFERSLSAILMACVTVALYAGLVWGVLPVSGRVSWEAHLFGALAGIFAASVQRRPATQRLPAWSGLRRWLG